MGNMQTAHAVFSRRLLNDFCSEITGKDISVLEGIHPHERFLVGMLSPRSDNSSSMGGSDVFVSRTGMDLFFREENIPKTNLCIQLQGDLFYRAQPTLQQQRNAFLQDVAAGKLTDAKTFEDLLASPPPEITRKTCKPVPVYKKISLGGILPDWITVALGEIYSKDHHAGKLAGDHPANAALDKALYQKGLELREAEDAYRKNNEPVKISDLESEDSWKIYLERACGDHTPVLQCWYFLLTCDLQLLQNGLVRVSVRLNNDSKVQESEEGKPSSDKDRVNDLFNATITVTVEGGAC